MTTEYAVFCGLDVDKAAHDLCALDPDGQRLFDPALPQDEARLKDLFTRLSEHGRVLVVVDQPNTIGALPIAAARAMGVGVRAAPGSPNSCLRMSSASVEMRWPVEPRTMSASIAVAACLKRQSFVGCVVGPARWCEAWGGGGRGDGSGCGSWGSTNSSSSTFR